MGAEFASRKNVAEPSVKIATAPNRVVNSFIVERAPLLWRHRNQRYVMQKVGGLKISNGNQPRRTADL
jgi:hypothetical protein